MSALHAAPSATVPTTFGEPASWRSGVPAQITSSSVTSSTALGWTCATPRAGGGEDTRDEAGRQALERTRAAGGAHGRRRRAQDRRESRAARGHAAPARAAARRPALRRPALDR